MPEPLTIYVCPDERCAKVSTIPTSCAGELGRYHHEPVARVAVRVFREDDLTSDDVVERGASALAIANGYNPNDEDPSVWPATTARFRDAARVVLTGALQQEDQSA